MLRTPHRFALSLALAVCTALAAPANPLLAAGQTGELVFFGFDDVSLPWRDNLKLTLERPQRYPGNPVLTAGPPGSVDVNGVLMYGTVFEDGGKLRMWYIAQPQPETKYKRDTFAPHRPIAYAESTDGIHWDRPNLGLVEFRGSKQNNLVSIEPADHPFAVANDFVSVLKDEADPDPARRYKMVYIVYLPKAKHSTAATAISPDGLHWTLASTDEFTKGHFENTSLIRFAGLYYVSGQNLGRAGGHLPDGTDAGRAMTAFFSPDFQHWSSGRALSFFRPNYEPRLESWGRELHMGAGLWNRGNVIVGIYGRWQGETINRDFELRKNSALYDLKIELGLCLSNDAIHYREPIVDFTYVAPGEEGQWDSHGLLQGQAFHNTDTQTYIWYSDWYTRNTFPTPVDVERGMTRPQSVGLLTLRRDGFGYLSKFRTTLAQQPGMQRTDTAGGILSQSVTLEKPGRLELNIDRVVDAAPLEVSLVDDAEKSLPGFEPVKIVESGLRVPVKFATAAIPSGQKFRVKIRWPEGEANPRFYALYLVPN
jgi:hypothetical protein